jgi:hypothetical protein
MKTMSRSRWPLIGALLLGLACVALALTQNMNRIPFQNRGISAAMWGDKIFYVRCPA